MILRRHAQTVAAGGLIGVPILVMPKPLAFQPVTSPEPMAQIASGGPSGLLASA